MNDDWITPDVVVQAGPRFARQLPPAVAVGETVARVPVSTLFDAERAALGRAAEGRQADFATGRWCARAALAALDVAPAPLLPTASRAPAWPEGIVGSITHCDAYCAAAVARRRDVAAIGIDAEPHEPLPADVAGYVLRAAERAHAMQLGDEHPGIHWGRVIFSIKESLFKAWHPVTERWLEFDEADVTIDPHGGGFVATLQHAALPAAWRAGRALAGRWSVDGALITTSLVLFSDIV